MRNQEKSREASRKKLTNTLPCAIEREASLQCVVQGSKEACSAQFDEYRACMREWRERERAARRGRSSQ
jgi:hypothetical protein